MKKIMLSIIVCLFLFEGQALAHTGLESSNPTNGASITEQLNEISLTFETKIEKTSSFELVNSNKEEFPISNITVSDTNMTGSIDQTLPNGDYTILWKIIGADGHLINGEVAFTQNAPILEEDKEEINTSATEQVEKEPITEEVLPAEEEKSSNTLLITIIVALVAILAGSTLLIIRRKEK